LADVERPDIDDWPIRFVLLPVDMTESQLTKLLADCPLYTTEEIEILKTDPLAFVPRPSVGWDYPVFDGAGGGYQSDDPIALRLQGFEELVRETSYAQLREAGLMNENNEWIGPVADPPQGE
jgi:hypothetical protein